MPNVPLTEDRRQRVWLHNLSSFSSGISHINQAFFLNEYTVTSLLVIHCPPTYIRTIEHSAFHSGISLPKSSTPESSFHYLCLYCSTKMLYPYKYLVGWICATWTEYVAAQAALDEVHEQPKLLSPNDSNDYTLGIIGDHNVAIACSPYSEYKTTSAATVATNMLRSFPNIRMGLLVGIGGGLQHDIRLGDIVVGIPRDGQGSVFQYDFDETVNTRAFRKTRFLSPLPFSVLKEVTSLRAEQECKGYRIGEVKNHILQMSQTLQKIYKKPDLDADLLLDPEVSPIITAAGFYNRKKLRRVQNNPTVHYGVIASAKQPSASRCACCSKKCLMLRYRSSRFSEPLPIPSHSGDK